MRLLFTVTALATLALAVCLSIVARSSEAAGEAFPGQGFLPDNRVWEMVSPPDKNGANVSAVSSRTRAAVDGDAIGFIALGAFGDAIGAGVANDYIARRSPDPEPGHQGWSTHGTTPAMGSLPLQLATPFEPQYSGELSDDLSTGIYASHTPLTDDPMVAQRLNLYRRSDLLQPGAGSYELMTACPRCAAMTPPTPLPPLPTFGLHLAVPWLADATPDLERVIFESNQPLTPDSPSTERIRLFEWHQGTVSLVGRTPVLPATSCDDVNGPACTAGTTTELSLPGQGTADTNVKRTDHTISDGSDGHSRVFFTRPTNASGGPTGSGFEGRVHMRVDGSVTHQISASERTVPTAFARAKFLDAAADGSRAFFSTPQALTDDAPDNGQPKLYMYDTANVHDEVQRVSVSATAGTFNLTFAGETTADLPFDATASQVSSALQALSAIGGTGGSVTVTGGPGDAAGSTPYEVAFRGQLAGTDQPLMTAADGATPLSGGSGVNVVPWVNGGGHLTFISADEEPSDGTSTEAGNVVGTSDDGRYVYFLALGQIVSGEPSLPAQGLGVYLWHDGEVTYIGSVPTGNAMFELSSSGVGTPINPRQARVTPDGRRLLFGSFDGNSLLSRDGGSDYDHGFCADIAGLDSCRELYVYEADDDSLKCASCNPSGAPGAASATISHNAFGGGSKISTAQNNAISDDGRYVFFSTGEALVPQDVNGPCETDKQAYGPCADAYVYDTQTGQHSLLSSGKSEFGSFFLDASDDGQDVFFTTAERLSGWDVDGNYDIYDARVGGGFPEPDPEEADCSGDGCQDPPSSTDPASRLTPSALGGPGDPPAATRRDLERCDTFARSARRASRRARSLRRRASKASGQRAVRLRRQARRASRSARRASSAARRCRAEVAQVANKAGGHR